MQTTVYDISAYFSHDFSFVSSARILKVTFHPCEVDLRSLCPNSSTSEILECTFANEIINSWFIRSLRKLGVSPRFRGPRLSNRSKELRSLHGFRLLPILFYGFRDFSPKEETFAQRFAKFNDEANARSSSYRFVYGGHIFPVCTTFLSSIR